MQILIEYNGTRSLAIPLIITEVLLEVKPLQPVIFNIGTWHS